VQSLLVMHCTPWLQNPLTQSEPAGHMLLMVHGAPELWHTWVTQVSGEGHCASVLQNRCGRH
jgi:hypothetical protein